MQQLELITVTKPAMGVNDALYTVGYLTLDNKYLLGKSFSLFKDQGE